MRSHLGSGLLLGLTCLLVVAAAPSAAWVPTSNGGLYRRGDLHLMKGSKGTDGTKPAAKSGGPLATILQVYTQDGPGSAAKEEAFQSRQYTLITGLPLKPFFERKTVRYQVTPDIWTFEQPQGFFNVTTSVRMTVVRLENGDLWVHDPIAATGECIRLLNELGGRVAHIVLATTGFEHKVFVRNFAKKYPKAKVYAAPDQWSWPINLPPPFRVDGGYLQDSDTSVPWAAEIEQALFQPPVLGIGPANEVVFFHKKSKTLICTDLVVFIKAKEPVAVADTPDLLAAAREDESEPIPADSTAARNRGWARMALQILFLGPTNFSTFKLVSDRLLVSPVIQTFVLSKIPGPVSDFINSITSRWAFEQVIPAHFNAPARATPRELQQAFAFAYELSGVKPAKPAAPGVGGAGQQRSFWEAFLPPAGGGGAAPLKKAVQYPASDMATLDAVNKFIVAVGVADK